MHELEIEYRNRLNPCGEVRRQGSHAASNKKGNGDLAVSCVLVISILQNFILSFANNHFFSLNQSSVIIMQLLINILVFIIILAKVRSGNFPLIGHVYLFGIILLVSALYTQSINFRYIYDSMTIPFFILLGRVDRAFNAQLWKKIFYLIIAVAIFELFFPTFYTNILNPGSYYYNTRSWVASFYNARPLAQANMDAFLYVGSHRPGGSFFGLDHRVGSVFLEPLSLGYYAVISAIVFLSDDTVNKVNKCAHLFGCIMLSVLSDTRLSLFLIFVVGVLYVCRHMLGFIVCYVLPVILMMAMVVAWNILDSGVITDLGYRISITATQFGGDDVENIVFGGIDATNAGDSGILYHFGNSGIFGFYLFLLLASGAPFIRGRSIYNFIVASSMIFIFGTLCFGSVVHSIKIAAPLGYMIGTMSNFIPSRQRLQARRLVTAPAIWGPSRRQNSGLNRTDSAGRTPVASKGP